MISDADPERVSVVQVLDARGSGPLDSFGVVRRKAIGFNLRFLLVDFRIRWTRLGPLERNQRKIQRWKHDMEQMESKRLLRVFVEMEERVKADLAQPYY